MVSTLRWPGEFVAGQVLNGIQGHQDMFTSLAAVEQSARNHIFYYYESKLTAVRRGPWKFPLSTKRDDYANLVPRTVPLVFHLRMDPFESYDSSNAYGHLLPKVPWLMQPMGERMGRHLQSLAESPPVQGASRSTCRTSSRSSSRRASRRRGRSAPGDRERATPGRAAALGRRLHGRSDAPGR